jgi:hypothetical protein
VLLADLVAGRVVGERLGLALLVHRRRQLPLQRLPLLAAQQLLLEHHQRRRLGRLVLLLQLGLLHRHADAVHALSVRRQRAPNQLLVERLQQGRPCGDLLLIERLDQV